MSGLQLIIGNKNYSSWSLRPWILLRHYKMEFEEIRIPLFTETTDAQLRPFFSNHKVPVLVDNTSNIWDSLAIMEHLNDKFLQGIAWPRSYPARAHARSVSAEMHSSFNAMREALPMNCRKFFPEFALNEAVLEDVTRIQELWRFCRNHYGQEGKYLFGDFSIADAMFAPVVLRFAGYDVKLCEVSQSYAETMLRHPDIEQWIADARLETEIIDMDEV